jgi:hypothetical protein
VRLDRDGEAATVSDLRDRYSGAWDWFAGELTNLNDGGPEADLAEAERIDAVRLYPTGLHTGEPIDTGGGPYLVVVDGDLTTSGWIRFTSDDYVPGLVVVSGDVRAQALLFRGIRVVVLGSVVLSQGCFGWWGDANGMLHADGVVDSPVIAVDIHTAVFSEAGLQGVIFAGRGWWSGLEPDTMDEECFRPEALDADGSLDMDAAFAVAGSGMPVLRPGVAENYPQRLRPRRAMSSYRVDSK